MWCESLRQAFLDHDRSSQDHSLGSLACSYFQAKCLLVTLCAANSESFLEIK